MIRYSSLRRRIVLLAGSVLALLALSASAAAAADLPNGFHDTTEISGLREPTTFKFGPAGEVFVALKNGRILYYESLADPVPTEFANLAKQVYDNGDRGLLGLALDPQFPTKPYVYVLYTFDHVLGEDPAGAYPRWGQPPSYEGDPCPKPESADVDACPVSGRLVRLTAVGDHAAPSAAAPQEKVLIEDWCQQDSSHSIGDLAFGPEGALFASGGEGASFTSSDWGQFGWPHPNQCGDPPGAVGTALSPPHAEGGSLRSQDVRTLGDPTTLDGTLIRIDPETGEGWPGNPLAGNPAADANARKIVAYGFRNPFRFAIDPRHGDVYVNNVGWGTDEEIDRVPIGSGQLYNSGWPCYEGLEPNPGFLYLELDVCEQLYQHPEAVSAPFFYYNHATVVAPGDPCASWNGSAISGSAFYEGARYPAQYHDALFFADAVRGCVYVMFADADGEPDPSTVTPFLNEYGVYPAVDIEQGPEGDLFYASLFGGPEEGTIHRLSYDPGAPRASLAVDQAWGTKSRTFEFDAGGSSSPAGDQLRFDWDFNEDGAFEVANGGPTQSKQFNTSENRTVAVKVTDVKTGKYAIAEVTVYPGDSPPSVTIQKPLGTATWGVGQTLEFAGGAIANGGAAIPPKASSGGSPEGLYWKTRLLHCPFGAGMCHEHPLQVFPGVEAGEFKAPDHDYPAALRISLTATDGRGLSSTKTVEIQARPVPLQLRSEPPGVELTAGPATAAAPYQLTAIENGPVSLSAPATADLGGTEYVFTGWSDGGARSHTVTAAAPATYLATYRAVPKPSQPNPEPPAAAPQPLPRAHLTSHPPARRGGPTARFRFAADQADAWFQCDLDGAGFRPCASPRVYRHLKPGPHQLLLRALTPGGKPQASPLEFGWRVRRPRGG